MDKKIEKERERKKYCYSMVFFTHLKPLSKPHWTRSENLKIPNKRQLAFRETKMRKITHLSTDTRNAWKQRSDLFKALKNTTACLESYAEKLPFKNKHKIKTFPYKHKLREFVSDQQIHPTRNKAFWNAEKLFQMDAGKIKKKWTALEGENIEIT